jgi:hypothetical protein
MSQEIIRHHRNQLGGKFTSMQLAYPSKIIVAWAEAIGGKKEIREWLLQSEYKELGLFVHALHHQEGARKWLMENGFPHLMALIHGAEGSPNAILWLRKHQLDVLQHMALAADNKDDSLIWLMSNGFQDMAMVAQRIRKVKNDLEDSNNDVHRISIY